MKKRLLVYISILIVMVVAIELKKAKIRQDKAKQTISLLNEYGKQGFPVDTYQIKRGSLSLYQMITLTKVGGDKAAFFVTLEKLKNVRNGLKVFDEKNSTIGTITSISNHADYATGMYKGVIELKSSKLWSGKTFLLGKIVISTISNSLNLPREAIVTDEDGTTHVWIKDGNKAVKKGVEIGLSNGELVTIKSGLKEGEEVILKGWQVLNPDSVINVRRCLNCDDMQVGVNL